MDLCHLRIQIRWEETESNKKKNKEIWESFYGRNSGRNWDLWKILRMKRSQSLPIPLK